MQMQDNTIKVYSALAEEDSHNSLVAWSIHNIFCGNILRHLNKLSHEGLPYQIIADSILFRGDFRFSTKIEAKAVNAQGQQIGPWAFCV